MIVLAELAENNTFFETAESKFYGGGGLENSQYFVWTVLSIKISRNCLSTPSETFCCPDFNKTSTFMLGKPNLRFFGDNSAM
jgi:hypothetical protein